MVRMETVPVPGCPSYSSGATHLVWHFNQYFNNKVTKCDMSLIVLFSSSRGSFVKSVVTFSTGMTSFINSTWLLLQ